MGVWGRSPQESNKSKTNMFKLCQDIVAGSARTESQGVTVQQGRGVCLLLDAILASGGEWAAVDCVGGVADARNGSGGGGGGL